FENQDNQYTEIAHKVGLNDYGIGRGSVVFDIENDGDLDLLVVNQKAVLPEYPVASHTLLYRNDSTSGNWLKIKLVGQQSEANGLGSRVRIVVGNTQMIREIDGGGSSHLSQNSTLAHFGLGDATVVDSVIVDWIGGERQVLTQQAVNQLLVVEEIVKENTKVWWYLLGVGGLVLVFSLLRRSKKSPISQ
ncbi:MAG: ASPIC/UnbV domain-containing protein, partial [Bacteroidota bacterium]